MMLTHLLAAFVLLFPAPKEPAPDDKGPGYFGVALVDNGGVAITRVEPGSPAERAGIRVEDIIRAIDENPVANVEEARDVIARIRPGAVTAVDLRRGGMAVTVKVKVGIRPETLP